MKQKSLPVRQAGLATILIVVLIAVLAVGGYLIYSTQTKPISPSHEIFVQFAKGTDIRLREGKLVSLTGVDLRNFYNILSKFEVQIERLYSNSEKELDAERVELEQRSGKELPDKNLAYLLRIAPNQDVKKLTDLLNALPVVEIAEPASIPINP